MKKKVLVLGGGIAGLSSSFYLAQEGIEVVLVEKSCFLGGWAISFTCKATDKCQQCGACIVEEMLGKVVKNPNIQIYLNSELEEVKKNKRFKVKLKRADTSIQPSNILRGFSKYNIPRYVVKEKTSDVPKDAVKIDVIGVDGVFEVDSIIIATGFTPFDPTLRPTYAYNTLKDVITGLELERMLKEHCFPIRPSNNQRAKKISFIQCVGSRNKEFNSLWCSEVCCPYALRMASVIKHKDPEAEITVFFIDVQNVSKEYDSFIDNMREKVRFINSVPIDILFDQSSLSPKVVYRDKEVGRKEEVFDLVVLSVGILPNEDNKKISKITEVELKENGFFKSKTLFSPSLTNNEGVFLAGTVVGPKNIIDTISHARGAVVETLRYLRRI